MISIFIIYSIDRAKALDATISCLRDMPLYEKCQRTLIVDGKIDKIPHDWEAVQIPRIKGKFCWGRMWDAGVGTALNETVVYLDSDRLLPRNYLELVAAAIKHDTFIFTSMHFLLLEEPPIDDCKKFLYRANIYGFAEIKELIGKIRYEARLGEPFHGPSKNVMSGSTAFTRSTYYRLGGVDHWYCGHGAFADTDFHMQASVGGCQFIDLKIPELHWPHKKLDQDNIEINQQKLYKLGLDNFIYYCYKWDLPMALAEGLALRSGITRPSSYVDKKVRSLKEVAKVSAEKA
jgi:hypothetical protein